MKHYARNFRSSRSVLYRRVAGGTVFFASLLFFNNCSDPGSLQMEATGGGQAGLSGPIVPITTPVAELDPATKFANVAGVYSSGSLQIVFPDGTYWTFGGYGIIQARTGTLTEARDGNFNGMLTGGTGQRGAFTGVYVQGTSFAGAPYQASSKTPPNLALAVGTFWGNSQDGDTPNLTFDAGGNITGYSANRQCTFRGKVAAHPSGLNVLKLTLTRSNCLNNGLSDTYTGVARAYGGVVHFAAVTADSSKAFTWEGYRL